MSENVMVETTNKQGGSSMITTATSSCMEENPMSFNEWKEQCLDRAMSNSQSPPSSAARPRPKAPAALVVSARDFFKGLSPRQLRFWRFVGAVMCTSIAILYYFVPLASFVLIPSYILLTKASYPSLIMAALWLVLAVLPSGRWPLLRHSKIYNSVPLYFDADLYLEDPPADIEKHPKPLVWLLYPHGVISFGGWSFGSMINIRPSNTAGASILLIMPLLRHILGVFGLVSGSRSSLRHVLRELKEDVCIYPGGVAELFLSNAKREQLYFDHRKGCIKLALETGADINVSYLFGNTMMFHLLISEASAKISRALKSSLTIFWGRYGTPLAEPTKVTLVTGRILKMPDYSHRPQELTMDVINQEHARVKAEIERVFDTYKHLHAGYRNKKLTII